MKTIASPIYVTVINDHSLRFFTPPFDEPHLPWHSVDDLYSCLRFPRDLRHTFKRKLQRDYKDDVRTIATQKGITTIAPHWMAQGLIASAEENGLTLPGKEWAYAAADDAWNAWHADLSPVENMELMLLATRNTHGPCGGRA